MRRLKLLNSIQKSQTLDRKDKVRRSANPGDSRRAEQNLARSLRKIARQVGDVVQAFDVTDPSFVPTFTQIMEKMSDALGPWALRTASAMVAEVEARDRKAWLEAAAQMSEALRKEIRSAPTGEAMRELLAEQVTLIKSIPLEAAQRVHKLTLKSLEDSTRSTEIAAEIMRSGEVAVSRANLIARTETSRTASVLTEARAVHIGSPGYFWRTSEDSDVRPDHKILNGKFIPWDSPPIADRRTGRRAHAGCIYGCRCYPEPVLPE